MHMQPYAPDRHVLQEQRAVQDNTAQVGSYVAVLDGGEDQHYHLALVTDISDKIRVLRYLGTGSTELRSAVWHWAYRRKRGKQRYELTREDRPNHQLVGDVDSLPVGQSLIVLPNVGLDEHM